MLGVSQMKRSIRDAHTYANFGSKIVITLRVWQFNFHSSDRRSILYIAEEIGRAEVISRQPIIAYCFHSENGSKGSAAMEEPGAADGFGHRH
jgi:hypothetical protein